MEEQDREDNKSRNVASRVKILVAFIVLVGALGYFSFLAFKGATVYYYTVSEIMVEPATVEGKMVRVSGKLVLTLKVQRHSNHLRKAASSK